MLKAPVSAWKDKTLDYEIETPKVTARCHTKSTGSWKDKTLDYEIETLCRPGKTTPKFTWKDKTLDYEIETL